MNGMQHVVQRELDVGLRWVEIQGQDASRRSSRLAAPTWTANKRSKITGFARNVRSTGGRRWGKRSSSQHQLSHECRPARQAAMRRLISLQVVRDQRIGQREGLSKSQAHAFAGDGVHRAGSVADQHGASSIDSLQTASDCDGAALFARVAAPSSLRASSGKRGRAASNACADRA